MIAITASGFISKKPVLTKIRADLDKCEFSVVSSRSAKVSGQWTKVYESAIFVAWGQDAQRISEIVDAGFNMTCTGIQETSSWIDNDSQKRYSTKYRLTAWDLMPRPQSAQQSKPQGGQNAPRPERNAPAAKSAQDDGEFHHQAHGFEEQGGYAESQRAPAPAPSHAKAASASADDFLQM